MKSQKVYFQNLDIFRFIAAYVVLLSHVELTLALTGSQNNWSSPWADLIASDEENLWGVCGGSLEKLMHTLSHEMGAMAVVFFFVLSGFLITLLLLRENHVKGKIDVKKFYLRRILRIWPLYFLVVILGLYVLPNLGDLFVVKSQTPNLSMDWSILDFPYLLILPNLSNALMLGAFPPNIGHAWSIGVEEQFYLFWPWLFMLTKAKPKWLIIFIGFMIVLKFSSVHYSWPRWIQILLVTMKFESMAVGGIGAFLFHHGWFGKVPIIIWRFLGVFGIFGVLVTFFTCPSFLQDALFLIQSSFFLLVVLSGVMLPNRMPSWLKVPLIWLGQRSYGIYMWHMMFLTLSANMVTSLDVDLQVKFMLTLFGSSVLTILVSHLSFTWVESPFLHLKSRIAKIL